MSKDAENLQHKKEKKSKRTEVWKRYDRKGKKKEFRTSKITAFSVKKALS